MPIKLCPDHRKGRKPPRGLVLRTTSGRVYIFTSTGAVRSYACPQCPDCAIERDALTCSQVAAIRDTVRSELFVMLEEKFKSIGASSVEFSAFLWGQANALATNYVQTLGGR